MQSLQCLEEPRFRLWRALEAHLPKPRSEFRVWTHVAGNVSGDVNAAMEDVNAISEHIKNRPTLTVMTVADKCPDGRTVAEQKLKKAPERLGRSVLEQSPCKCVFDLQRRDTKLSALGG